MTVQSILQNEKYKEDALLQKEFTVDFLTRKLKKNEGELPQYYVEEDHEPIISPWLFDYVQKRLKERGFQERRSADRCGYRDCYCRRRQSRRCSAMGTRLSKEKRLEDAVR